MANQKEKDYHKNDCINDLIKEAPELFDIDNYIDNSEEKTAFYEHIRNLKKSLVNCFIKAKEYDINNSN